MAVKTRDGFSILQIKQIQGRVFDRLLRKQGLKNFTALKGILQDITLLRTIGKSLLVSRLMLANWKVNTTGPGEMNRLFYKGLTDEEILKLDARLEKTLKKPEKEERKI